MMGVVVPPALDRLSEANSYMLEQEKWERGYREGFLNFEHYTLFISVLLQKHRPNFMDARCHGNK